MQRECRRVIAGTTLLSCLFASHSAQAMDVAVAKSDQDPCEEAVIEGYEPNTFGYTKQSDDVAFVDFTISIKAQLFRDLLCQRLRGKSRLYLTFTGRFGFYVRTRNSGPVIAKNYNPKLLWRVIPDPAATTPSTAYDVKPISEYSTYIDLAYAHDSNGQSIDTLQEYGTQASQAGDPRYAIDYVSRGWDYVQVTGKKTFSGGPWGSGVLSVYPDFKFFLRHGFLQGVPEEYHSWEHDSALHPRHAFDGLSAAFEYRPFAHLIRQDQKRAPWQSGLRFELKYTTGYDPVARYNTVRGEVGFYVFGLPLTVWAQDGYMNSLARYYKKTKSGGIELRFAQF
jgi:hypothetical protein